MRRKSFASAVMIATWFGVFNFVERSEQFINNES